jgi:glucan 1,3-beta-glucosidase
MSFETAGVYHYRCEPRHPLEEDEDGGGGTRRRSGSRPPTRKKLLNDFHLRGTSLGGLFVLEPWITPSLFYQFLGLTDKYGDEAYKHIAIDSKTFCLALGNEEANRQLRRHWKTWVDEAQIASLASKGVETLRIPLGDWMFLPYAPYIGCWNGALDELDRILKLCGQYGMTALLDIHAMRLSQNGLDNSGDTGSYQWLKNRPPPSHPNHMDGSSDSPVISRYRHWDIRGGNWAGRFNLTTNSYTTLNMSNIELSLEVVKRVVERYHSDKVVVGFTPVNEPWGNIPLDVLKDYYWRSYQIVQERAPHWITLMHDSFRLTPESWGSPWMENCDNWAMDTHIYQAWSDAAPSQYYADVSCASHTSKNLAVMESIGVPVVVGEWSLATDNCAMWLNGLNDNIPGFPKVECDYVRCPSSYMGAHERFAPPTRHVNSLDPEGTGGPSYVVNGTCPRDKSFPDELNEVQVISYAQLNVFDGQTHGNFFWNFRNEFEPRWNYQTAVENAWIPADWSRTSPVQKEIASTCAIVKSSTHTVEVRSGRSVAFEAMLMVSIFMSVAIAMAYAVKTSSIFRNRYRYISVPSVQLHPLNKNSLTNETV